MTEMVDAEGLEPLSANEAKSLINVDLLED
jgi:hypothetical protein